MARQGTVIPRAERGLIDDVRAARKLLDGVVRMTPLEHSRVLAAAAGGPVHLKCENLQRTGSFKIRGAYVRIARLPPEERAAGVVAASAGNHAQGVALAAALLGMRPRCSCRWARRCRRSRATRDVRRRGPAARAGRSTRRWRAAQEYAAETGAVFIHPFDHPDIIAGQGTVGLEILEQCPEVRTIARRRPAAAGWSPASRSRSRRCGRTSRWSRVQAEAAAAYPPSLAAGRPVSLEPMATMADGIAVGRPGRRAVRDHRATLVDEVVTVSEDALSSALLLAWSGPSWSSSRPARARWRRVLAEPRRLRAAGGGGAVRRQRRPGAADAGDPARHGRAPAATCPLRLRITDRPGALAALLGGLPSGRR